MYCKKCGATAKDGAKFCTKCGAELPKRSKKPFIIIGIVAGAILLCVLLAVVAEPLIDNISTNLEIYENAYVYHGGLSELLREDPDAVSKYTRKGQKIVTDDYIVERQDGINDSVTAIRYKYGLVETYDRFEKFEMCVTDRETGQDYLFEYMYDIHQWINW